MNNTTRQGFLTVLVKSTGFALQWRMLLLWVVVLLLPTTMLTLPVWHVIGAQLNYSALSPALAHHLNMNAVSDIMAAMSDQSGTMHATGLVALITTLLLSPFLSGMMVTAARAQVALGFGKLVHGGIAEYWRMLRSLIWGLIPIAVAVGLGNAASTWADGVAEKAILESTANSASHAALAITLILFLIAEASVVAGRAQFVHSVNRRSAIKAWWRGIKLVLSRPVSAFLQFVVLTLIGLAVAAVFGLLRINLGHVSLAGFAVSILLTQLLVATIGWMQAARIYALAQISN